MSNRNTPLIATLVAVVLCGLPGLFGLCFGATTLLAGFTPGAEIDIFGSTDQASATTLGALVLCLSLILMAMPLVVWLVTRRRRSGLPPAANDEPVPPAS
jgi:hypothetical protein